MSPGARRERFKSSGRLRVDMPLDPEMRTLLEAEAAQGLSALERLPPGEARALADKAQRELDASVGAPLPVGEVRDIEIALPGRSIAARAYWPVGWDRATPLPVLAYFHGGGWVVGSLAGSDATCRELANRAGCAVVSVAYRLAPEHKFPAAVEDAVDVTIWLSTEKNAAALRVNGSSLIVAGDSAGGNLAAVVALHSRDHGKPGLLGQVLLCPVTDTDDRRPSYRENAHGYGFEIEFVPWMWKMYLRSEADRTDPRLAVLRIPDLIGLAPAFVLTAEFDMLRDEGEEYAARMRDAGVAVVARRYPGVVHNFIEYRTATSQGRSATRAGREAIVEIAGWIRDRFAAPR